MKRFRPEKCDILPLDSYYRDLTKVPEAELYDWNFDRPASFDQELLIEQVTALSQGCEIERPVYRYPSHTRDREGILIKPKEIIIVEGLFGLYWAEVRSAYSLSIFVDAPQEVCFERRSLRDVKERGFEPDYIKFQFETTVLPMYKKYIEATRQHADLVVNGGKRIEESVEFLFRKIERLEIG